MSTRRDALPPFAARMGRMSESATAAVFRRVAELRAQGVDLVSLSVGEPDFDPPAHVLEAAKRAIDSGASRYTEVVGLRSLREAICQDSADRRGVAHEPDQVVVSAGAKHALFNLAQALYDHGDEVVIPVPAWGTYAEQARLCGATPVQVPCSGDDGYLVRPEALAGALTERTKAVVLCSPSNPTGAAYDEAQLRALARVLEGSRAVVIVDEIYGTLTYDGFVQRSLLTLAPALRERLVIVDGVSKRFAMTGYRVGWMLAPRPLARACEAVQSQATTSIAAVAQLAAEAALRGSQEPVEAMRACFEARRDRLMSGLSGIEGLEVARPRGAFYLFVDVRGLMARGFADDVAVARHLLDRARVAVVPGSAFGAPGHIRLSYATSEAELDRAVEQIGDVLS
ncbi:MAG: pyridoxal phosphate-dependent aminotransferase [Myxococcales bacterium]